jgi:hypothetical protein
MAAGRRSLALAVVAAVLVFAGVCLLVRFWGGSKGDYDPTVAPTPTPAVLQANTDMPVLPPLPAWTMPPLLMAPTAVPALPPTPIPTPQPEPTRVIDAAALVGVLPDAVDVAIESDDPDLRKFSGTYYYSVSGSFGDPRIRSWAWTLDSVAAPGGNAYRGETRAQLSYGNDSGKWTLSLNTLAPYPEPPVLLRATTGPLRTWDSVWGAKWIRVEPLSTIDSKRPLVMPLIKVRARGTGVIALVGNR